jgi:hypothetical protein
MDGLVHCRQAVHASKPDTILLRGEPSDRVGSGIPDIDPNRDDQGASGLFQQSRTVVTPAQRQLPTAAVPKAACPLTTTTGHSASAQFQTFSRFYTLLKSSVRSSGYGN